jgi:hypothetical protein
MTQAAILAASATSGVSQSLKNRIINGAMVIDQRNAGASVTQGTSDTYSLDRFLGYGNVTSKFTMQQSSTAPAGFVNSVVITSSAATVVGSTDQYYFAQKIEGYNTADLNWGSANAKTVTLSFWARASVIGAYSVFLLDSSSAYSYIANYTISTANTWEQKTITIVAPTVGTWLTTNGVGIYLGWDLGSGSTLNQTAGAWQAGSKRATSGSTQLVATSGATLYLTGVQLEVGTTATNFEYRQYGTELALCQRYYETSFDIGTAPANAVNDNFKGIASFGTSDSQSFSFKVYKRAAPTMSWYSSTAVGSPTAGQWQFLNSGSAWANGVATQTNRATMSQCSVYVNSSGNLGSGQASSIAGNWAASAEL